MKMRLSQFSTMAPLDYLPESVSTPTFLKRLAPDGVYNRLGDAFSYMGTAAIANADVDSTFFEYTPDELQPDCHYYRDCESAVGEVLGQAHGTFIGARGNHYPGPNAARVGLYSLGQRRYSLYIVAQSDH